MIGLLDQVFGQIFRPKFRYSATERDHHVRTATDRDFDHVELPSNAVEKHSGLVCGSFGQDNSELIPADAAHDIFLPKILTNELREELQDLIASTVTGAVVD